MIRRGIRKWLRLGLRERVREELEDEIELHLRLRVEQLESLGWTREQAQAEAERRFGHGHAARQLLMKELELRERKQARLEWLRSAGQDVRIALRGFRRTPGFTLIAIVTLALGVGASAAIFSVVNAAMMAVFPFEQSDRLVILWGVADEARDRRGASYPEVQDWRAMARAVEDIAAYDEVNLNLSGRGPAEQLQAETVSAGYFELLGVSAARGRVLNATDDTPGGALHAVISHDMWQNRFGGAASVLGQTITLEGRVAEIVGIMPPDFRGISFDTEIWVPLLPFDGSVATDRGSRWLLAVGRMRDGVSLEMATTDLAAVARRLAEQHPDANRGRGVEVVPLRDYYLDSTSTLLLVLLGSVSFLLLIACANVTNLQLVRGLSRSRELAVRTALGAARGRIIRQLLCEAGVLAVLGGAAGLLLARWGTALLLPLVPDGVLPRYVDVRLDARVLLFCLLLVVLATLVSGLVPALRGARHGLSDHLRSSTGTSPTTGTVRLQQAIVVVELALALALLTGATLMVRSLQRQLAIDPGFRTEDALALRVSLPDMEPYTEVEPRARIASALLDELRATHGITFAGVASQAPLRGYGSAAFIERQDRPGEGIRFYRHQVTPGFFEGLGITIVEGRDFERTDARGAPRVAVVSEAFAARMWPEGRALGRVLRMNDAQGPPVTVIGVARDVHYRDLVTDLRSAGEDPDVYFAFDQMPALNFDVVVRSDLDRRSIVERVQSIVSRLDPSVPLLHVQTLSSSLAEQTAQPRFASFILTVFAILALTLAAVGLYGVIAFSVRARQREFALRLAIGANPAALGRLVIQQGLGLATVGVLIGVATALGGTRLLRAYLYDIDPHDGVTLLGVSLVLMITATIANLVPALRAARIPPQAALRSD